MGKRTTLYAAFYTTSTGTNEPVLNVYDFNEKRLDTLISDRVANGVAQPGEHKVQITVAMYNRLLKARGWPEVTTL